MWKALNNILFVVMLLATIAIGVPIALAGAILCMTIFGIPLGIPMIGMSGWLFGAVLGTRVNSYAQQQVQAQKKKSRPKKIPKEPGEKIDTTLYLTEEDFE